MNHLTFRLVRAGRKNRPDLLFKIRLQWSQHPLHNGVWILPGRSNVIHRLQERSLTIPFFLDKSEDFVFQQAKTDQPST